MIDNPLKLKLFIQGKAVPDFTGGACTSTGLDPETWFIDDPSISMVAKGYCQLCPFGPGLDGDDSCYDYFLQVEEQTGYFAYGIVGGRDAAKRQRILDIKKLAAVLAGEVVDEDEGSDPGRPQAEAL